VINIPDNYGRKYEAKNQWSCGSFGAQAVQKSLRLVSTFDE